MTKKKKCIVENEKQSNLQHYCTDSLNIPMHPNLIIIIELLIYMVIVRYVYIMYNVYV